MSDYKLYEVFFKDLGPAIVSSKSHFDAACYLAEYNPQFFGSSGKIEVVVFEDSSSCGVKIEVFRR